MVRHIPTIQLRQITQQVERRLDKETIQRARSIIKEEDPLLYGHYDPEEATMAFLYWILYYPSYRKLQEVSTIPHANMKQIFGTIRRNLETVATKREINPGTWEERRRISEEMIGDPELKEITEILDGSQIRVWGYKDSKERNLSKKMQFKPARNVIVAVRLDLIVIFVSDSFDGRRHDFKCLRKCSTSFIAGTNPRDVVAADAGFVGANNHRTLWQVRWRLPYKKPRRGTLTVDQTRFNTRLAQVRSHAELVFGRIKNMFAILKYPFRGPAHRLDGIVRVCCWLYNNERILEIQRRHSSLAPSSPSAGDRREEEEEPLSRDNH